MVQMLTMKNLVEMCEHPCFREGCGRVFSHVSTYPCPVACIVCQKAYEQTPEALKVGPEGKVVCIGCGDSMFIPAKEEHVWYCYSCRRQIYYEGGELKIKELTTNHQVFNFLLAE